MFSGVTLTGIKLEFSSMIFLTLGTLRKVRDHSFSHAKCLEVIQLGKFRRSKLERVNIFKSKHSK